ncbi:VOC family protein [Silvimonas iriomotensis]|uniref:Glyoxalase n=1 Tax=Silvimonas iriomotensis TaxID=449662 RepID=A0ABQ2P628_9NEIS|nr:VOC family protein [Silvimonas iriomotensis]GGP19068.1 glyoxalase [Silvimonas iriomotensis]
MSAVKPIPDGYQAITPYLISDNAAKAIDFYKAAFNATERMRMPDPTGKIRHAELVINGAVVMLADENLENGCRSPLRVGGCPLSIVLYVPDVDATVARAVQLGARLTRPVQDQFYGDRSGSVVDPDGYDWHLATHVEDVSEEEMKRRMAAL